MTCRSANKNCNTCSPGFVILLVITRTMKIMCFRVGRGARDLLSHSHVLLVNIYCCSALVQILTESQPDFFGESFAFFVILLFAKQSVHFSALLAHNELAAHAMNLSSLPHISHLQCRTLSSGRVAYTHTARMRRNEIVQRSSSNNPLFSRCCLSHLSLHLPPSSIIMQHSTLYTFPLFT